MNHSVLLKPFTDPKLNLKNRVIMAPMTRQFSPHGVPGKNVTQYYKNRAENAVA